MNRPDSYTASFAAVQPLLTAWRSRIIKGNVEVREVTCCPAYGGRLRVAKAILEARLSMHCETPFCVQHQEYRG